MGRERISKVHSGEGRQEGRRCGYERTGGSIVYVKDDQCLDCGGPYMNVYV